jgi:acyl-coenzyme A synthetase/AMP-(fatty) acid ligase
MLKFFEKYQESVKRYPDKTAFAYTGNGKTISYRELDEISGKAHRWLKGKGIGREDHVVIRLPRGAMIPAMMLGVWKNGSSCIVCEASMAKERVRYILADSEARAVIGENELKEILAAESLPGFEDVSLHDAAYAVYTSGTTGNPKGVVHEYGNLDIAMASHKYDGEFLCRERDVFAFNSPLNFVATNCTVINVLASGCTGLIVDVKTVKNPEKLMQTYADWGVTSTFMTPSLFRSCSVSFNPQLEWMLLGGEPCIGLYHEKLRLYNLYSASELGRDALLYRIDSPQEVTPVGKSQWGEEVFILDSSGEPVPDGESGELCFRNEYVRGYIGLPEKTKAAWHYGLYHTGDIAKRLPDGNIVLQGRNDDMIKIGGNRIEPAEIEQASKRILNLSWAAAKGFVTPERSYVVLYYTDERKLNAQESREALAKSLPEYMLPSYFIHLDSIPLLPTGKLDKKNLPIPDINCYRTEYAAPETALEEKLLAAFENVLGLTHLSVNDDFYDLGGDSLRSIQLINMVQDPALNVPLLYRNRSVRALACAMTEDQDSGMASLEERDRKAREHDQPLVPMQYRLLDIQLYDPESTFSNLPAFWRMPKEQVDQEKLLRTFEKLVRNQPLLQSVMLPSDDMLFVMHYSPEILPAVKVEKKTEEEISALREELIQPFPLLNAPLYRFRIFETEEYIYVFMDFHHLISDGSSMQVVLRNFSDAYLDKELPHDYAYLFLRDAYKRHMGWNFTEAHAWNMAKYGHKDWCRLITPDENSRSNHVSSVSASFPVSGKELKAWLEREHMTVNSLVVAASLRTIHEIEQKDDVLVGWLYHGRDQLAYQNCMAPVYVELPVAVSFGQIHGTDELLREVREQAREGINHADDPFIIGTTAILENDAFRIRNQGGMQNICGIEGIPSERVELVNRRAAASLMNVQVLETPDGEMKLNLTFCDQRYHRETAERVLQLLKDNILRMIS